ncbi:NEDD8-activating enzyme E1 catalytic subunit, putative [Plasmodium ovale]|nr:NEDD8-activating enzyme E1 catalytic subunit, putative [Plasmodium ovale]
MLSDVEEAKVLVVGCGGLGNEVIKNLVYLSVKNISIVDYDIVEVSNLQRQFFFTEKEIGMYKVEAISKAIGGLCKNVSVKGYVSRVECFDVVFFEGFDIIIGCVDNINSRIYLNSIIFNLKREVIYIDGGVEGFKGNVKIVNRNSHFACFQCTIGNYANYGNDNWETIPVCSVTNRATSPEDCILYAMNISFEKEKKEKLNIYDENHVKWIYYEAKKRAKQFGIDKVTYALTDQVIKNIIPTTASTVMIIASLMTNEMNNIFLLKKKGRTYNANISKYKYSDILYVGDNGLYLYYYKIYKNTHCVVCNKKRIHISLKKTDTLNKLLQFIRETYNSEQVSISSHSSVLFITAKCFNKKKNDQHKLNSTFQQLMDQGKVIQNGYLNVQTDRDNFLLFLHLE